MPVRRPVNPVGAFFIDLVVLVGLLMALSIASGLVWVAVVIAQAIASGAEVSDLQAFERLLGQPGAMAMIWMTLVSTGATAVVLYYWRRRATTQEKQASWQAARKPSTWLWMTLTAVATFSMSALLSLVSNQFGMAPKPSNLTIIQDAFEVSPVFMLAFGVLIAPTYEELLFRRVLFGRLWAAGRPWLGLVLSSAAFALMHEIPGMTGNSWQATGMLWLTYGFMGAAFAFVYWRTRTLWAALGAHALNNAIALALLQQSSNL